MQAKETDIIEKGSVDFLGKLVVVTVSLILVSSAVDKILHYQGLLAALRDYVLLPTWAAKFLGIPLISLSSSSVSG